MLPERASLTLTTLPEMGGTADLAQVVFGIQWCLHNRVILGRYNKLDTTKLNEVFVNDFYNCSIYS